MGLPKRMLKRHSSGGRSWDIVFELNKGEGISLTIEDVLIRLKKLKRVSGGRKSRMKNQDPF